MEGNNKMMIPGAIIVAGLLIGGAVIYSNGGGGGTPAGNENGGNSEIVIPAVTADDHILGNPDAKVVIVEYSDIDCPFCQRFHTTMHDIVDAYDGQVAWVYRHFPLTQLHPDAAAKAEAVECVGAVAGNDAYWTYLDTLFAGEEGRGDLTNIAVAMGVDQTAFEACLESGSERAEVEQEYTEALEAGGTGTPYSVILVDGEVAGPINGAQPFEAVKTAIDALL